MNVTTKQVETKELANAEWAKRGKKPLTVIPAKVAMVGESELLRQYPHLAQIENYAMHMAGGMLFGRSLRVTVIIDPSGKESKCNYARKEAFVTADTKEAVVTIVIKALWLSEPESLLQLRIVHEMAHARGALHALLTDSKQSEATAKGKHNANFRHYMLDWITDESMWRPQDYKDGLCGQNDVHMPKLDSFSFNDATISRIAEFGWNHDLINIERVKDVSKPRNGSKSVLVGCPKHFWKLEDKPKADEPAFRTKVKVTDYLPKCGACDKVYVVDPKNEDHKLIKFPKLPK